MTSQKAIEAAACRSSRYGHPGRPLRRRPLAPPATWRADPGRGHLHPAPAGQGDWQTAGPGYLFISTSTTGYAGPCTASRSRSPKPGIAIAQLRVRPPRVPSIESLWHDNLAAARVHEPLSSAPNRDDGRDWIPAAPLGAAASTRLRRRRVAWRRESAASVPEYSQADISQKSARLLSSVSP